MLRSRGVHFRDLGQAATMRPFRAAISTEGHPGLDGSIVIKSIGSYRFAGALACSTDLTPYLGMGPIEASTIRMHYEARERTCRQIGGTRNGRVISRLFAR